MDMHYIQLEFQPIRAVLAYLPEEVILKEYPGNYQCDNTQNRFQFDVRTTGKRTPHQNAEKNKNCSCFRVGPQKYVASCEEVAV